MRNNLKQHVVDLSLMGKESGINGCSSLPARGGTNSRKECGEKFLIVSPVSGHYGAASGDQQRVFTSKAGCGGRGGLYGIAGRLLNIVLPGSTEYDFI